MITQSRDIQLLLRLMLVLTMLVAAYIVKNPGVMPVAAQQATPTPSPLPGPDVTSAPQANVTLTLTDNVSTVRPGGSLTYQLVVRNHGDEDIAGMTVVVRLAEFLMPAEVSPEDADGDAAVRTVTWSNQTLAGEADKTYTIRADVQNEAPEQLALNTIAIASGAGFDVSREDTTTIRTNAQTGAGTLPLVTPAAAPVTAATGPGKTAGYVAALAMIIGIGGFGYGLKQSR